MAQLEGSVQTPVLGKVSPELQGEDKSSTCRFRLLVTFKPFPFVSGSKPALSNPSGVLVS